MKEGRKVEMFLVVISVIAIVLAALVVIIDGD